MCFGCHADTDADTDTNNILLGCCSISDTLTIPTTNAAATNANSLTLTHTSCLNCLLSSTATSTPPILPEQTEETIGRSCVKVNGPSSSYLMGGVLASFFSLGPTTSQSSNNGVGGSVIGDGSNIVGKSLPRVNNTVIPPATSDVSPSHYEQMRRQPQNATHNLSNIQSSLQQPQKPHHHHHQQHSSLANFLLFNGFHMYAFNGDIASFFKLLGFSSNAYFSLRPPPKMFLFASVTDSFENDK